MEERDRHSRACGNRPTLAIVMGDATGIENDWSLNLFVK
jgi:hypothetical protein